MKKLIKSLSLAALFVALLTPVTGSIAVACSIVTVAFAAGSLIVTAGSLLLLINPSDLDFHGDELRAISEAFYVDVFSKPNIKELMRIDGGIKAKKQIGILGVVNGLTGKGDGDCDPDVDTNSITNTQKFWDPVTISNNFVVCWKELKGTFFIWGTNNGIAKEDLTKTDFANFIVERYKDALLEEWLRHAWFGDKAAAHYSDSPAGVIKNGTTLAYFNKVDGLWKQIYAIVAATPARLTTDLASRNGQATYALQAFTTQDTIDKVVSDALLNTRLGADIRLREKPNLVFQVTQSVADQYERELTKYNIAFTTERLENGITVLKSGGLTLHAWNLWDRIIRNYYDNGTKWYKPHRILLTTSDNCVAGTEDENTLSQIELFYDKVKGNNHLKTMYDLDAKVIMDYDIQVAY